jgi:uncharacterized protein
LSKGFFVLVNTVAALLVGLSCATAQGTSGKGPAPKNSVFDQWRAKVNENTVSIVSGNPNGGYLGIAYDISAAIDDGDNMRVLPIVGKGAVQNVKDVLFLKGVDMGLANTVTLSHFRDDPELGRYVSRQMVYITRLFEDELHILVRPEIKTFKDLEGKRINFSDAGSGAQLAAQRMFKAFGMNVTEVNMGQADAIEKMKNNEVDATLCTCLKPLRPYQQVAAAAGFKLLEVPFEGPLEQDYVPATFSHEDYPNLIPKGETVQTVAVPTALVAYNWPADHERYKRLAKFVDSFFGKFTDLHKPPRHPRWKNVNIAATMQGWNRFAPAQAWLDKSVPRQVAVPAATAAAAVTINQANAGQAPGGAQVMTTDQQKLFQEFLEWRKKRGTQ